MAASSEVVSPQSEYIQHHLVHLNNLGFDQTALFNFNVINYDSVFWSLLTGLISVGMLWYAARSVTAGVPGRFQMAMEMLVDWVEDEAKAIISDEVTRRFMAPLALVLFLWITLMNALDLVPVDLLSQIFRWTGVGAAPHEILYYHHILPTSDLNVPLGMALDVLFLSLYYGIKAKNPLGFSKELFVAPFQAHGPAGILFMPFNLLLNLIEYVAKTASLALRLFGNMFAGELIFLLIALLGGVWSGFNVMSIGMGLGHIITGSAWAIFHVLICLLQAYIFMMLALVYVGLAQEGH